MDARSAFQALAALVLFGAAEAAICKARARLGAERGSVQARIEFLRDQSRARESAATAAAGSAREDSERARRLEEGGAPNHARILAILKALEAAKRRHGTADPRKLNRQYANAGMGVNVALMSDPDYSSRARTIQKYEAETDNWLLLRQLGARGVDTDRIASLLADQLLDPMEANSLAKKSGLSDKDSAQAAQSEHQDVQAELRRAVGPENARLYESLGTMGNGSFSAAMLDARLSYAAAPMDDRQFAAVAGLFGGQPPQLILEGRYDPNLAAKVQAILTPSQFAAFEALLREQKAP